MCVSVELLELGLHSELEEPSDTWVVGLGVGLFACLCQIMNLANDSTPG